MIERIPVFVDEKRGRIRIILGKSTSFVNDFSNLDLDRTTLGLILIGLALIEFLYDLASRYLERESQVRLKVTNLSKIPLY